MFAGSSALTRFALAAFHSHGCPSLTSRPNEWPQLLDALNADSDAPVAPCGEVTTAPLSTARYSQADSITDSSKMARSFRSPATVSSPLSYVYYLV